MDETKPQIKQQGSLGSDTTSEASSKSEPTPLPLDKRICLLGNVVKDEKVCAAAQSFGIPIVTSETGLEFSDDLCSTIYVMESFEGASYDALYKSKNPILGPPALIQLANKKEQLPNNTRPLYNLSMCGVVVCFTGFRNKDDLTKLVPLVHHMGGSIRKDMSSRVTHLIANTTVGDKYQYAATFRVPVMSMDWVMLSWVQRNDVSFTSTNENFLGEHKLKPFHGAKVCFVGFPEEEEKHMVEILQLNGGIAATIEEATCTHIVMDRAEKYMLEANSDSLSPKLQSLTSTSTLAPTSTLLTPVNPKFKFNPQDDTISELNDTIFDTTGDFQNLELEITKSSRKRKFISPDRLSFCPKKKCNMSYSENRRKKISDFFKTPLNYLSNRRKTIGANQDQSLDESVISTSGVFNVESLSESQQFGTPNTSRRMKLPKSLFSRTFSTSKFIKGKKKDFNLSKFSFCSEIDGMENMNSTCFPDFSDMPPPPNPIGEARLRSNGLEHPRPSLSHISVVDESSVTEKQENPNRPHIVKAEWFWTSVQKEISLDEKDYLFDDYIDKILSPNARRESHQATPSSASRRKRKRLHETLSSLVHQQSPGVHHKRRSSVSDAGLLSVSGSFLDCTASPDIARHEGPDGSSVPDTPRKALTARQQVFLELVQTESNYVNILHTIMTMFKKHLEDMPEEEALLNNTELKIIFGNVPPIYETHVKMLNELRLASVNWSEDKSIGNMILKYSTDLRRAYPTFVNFFEEMKEMLTQCDQSKPRFHAFLKACQTRPECGRQGLQDLLIRPVQRLPSISLLLKDILKHTHKSNEDHRALDQALASICEVMTHINEDKRKTEGQRVMFDIFNEIDNCPPDLVSSHRSFVAKSEVIQLSSSEGLSGKGNPLLLFLFSDQLEICKKRSKAFNTLKSPNTVNGLHKASNKPYKHIKLMSLSLIKRVIDIKETEDCQKSFGLVFRNNDELKERLFTFAMTDEDANKVLFLKTLCKQMATNACTADADKFLVYLDPQELDINTSDVSNGTFSKAFKFASRTRLKVGRAFSFNKTPSKLKRAVSSMMSPFGSSTNLTPATQLAQMRLASCNNISELGNAENVDSPPIVPLSVQPTRKLKTNSLGVNALKRL